MVPSKAPGPGAARPWRVQGRALALLAVPPPAPYAAAVRDVAIFRNNLFRISEPFITQQAQALRRHRPLYLGRLRFGDAPPGAESLALEDLGRWRSLPAIAWQVLARSPRGFERLLAGRRPSLVHAHFGIDGVHALPLARRLGVPLITTFHGFDATLSTAALLSSPAWANYPLHRARLAREGALFLCVSSFVRDRVRAQGFPASRTLVHYTGVDCAATRPREPGEETATILHVARLVEMKGTATLLHAFARLARDDAAALLVVIGDGELRRPLRALAAQLGLGARVRFLGALPHAEVMAWMRQAAMLVLPSMRTRTGRVEGLGMVLLEAAATGVPVVGSRVGGIPEGVLDGETGFLVPPGDADALCARMRDLLGDAALRGRLGTQARRFVERRFDMARQTAALEDFYDAAVAGARFG